MRVLILAAAVLWCGSQAIPLREPNVQKEQAGSSFSFSIKMEPPHPMFSNLPTDPTPRPPAAPTPPATPAPAPVVVTTTPAPTPAPVPETKPPAPAPKAKAPIPKKVKGTTGKDSSSIFTSFLENNFSDLDDLSLYTFGTQFGNSR